MTEREIIEAALRKATENIEKPNDLVMKKIRSSLLGKEADVRVVNNSYYEITHDNLEKVYLSAIASFEISYKPILTDMKHAVVECTATYRPKDTVRPLSITKVGEATSGNLKGPIQWNIPVSMAYMRAFDRAMIRLLSFEADKPIYSTMELDMGDYYEGQISREEYKLQMIDAEVLNMARNIAEEVKANFIEDVVPDFGEGVFDEIEDPLEAMLGESTITERIRKYKTPDEYNDKYGLETIEPLNPTSVNNTQEYKPTADTVLLLGNCKGMKLKDAVKEPKWNSFLTWIKDIDYKTTKPEVKKQADYFKKYANKILKGE